MWKKSTSLCYTTTKELLAEIQVVVGEVVYVVVGCRLGEKLGGQIINSPFIWSGNDGEANKQEWGLNVNTEFPQEMRDLPPPFHA
jgi:hypothetical protein